MALKYVPIVAAVLSRGPALLLPARAATTQVMLRPVLSMMNPKRGEDTAPTRYTRPAYTNMWTYNLSLVDSNYVFDGIQIMMGIRPKKKLGSQKYFKISVRYTVLGNWHTNIWNSSVENFLNPCVRIFFKVRNCNVLCTHFRQKRYRSDRIRISNIQCLQTWSFVVNPAYLALAGTFKLSSIMYS